MVTAAIIDNAALLFVALFVYGAGSATNLQARYAGADLASPTRRGRAVSTVLAATTLGGVAGPNLAAPSGDLAAALGIPTLAGPFLLAGLAYALAALVLMTWLRPDPLLLAREHAAATAIPDAPAANARAGPRTGRRIMAGGAVMAVTQLVMVAIMTITPVHLLAHGHGTAAAGLVIAIHVGAMYLPSPVTGLLVDRYGRLPAAAGAAMVLCAAGLIAATAPGGSLVLLALALALLGLGWNIGLITGTAIVTDAAPLATRAKTQGTVDVCVAIAGATGGMGSGLMVAATSYPALAIAGAALSLAVVPAAVLAARESA